MGELQFKKKSGQRTAVPWMPVVYDVRKMFFMTKTFAYTTFTTISCRM